jgi:molybdopterin biosynthesis enzyme
MHPFTLDPAQLEPAEALVGAVITEEVKADGRRLFRKGHRLGPDDLAALARVDRPLHAVRLEPGDVHEDEAGRRLAAAVAGDGLEIRGPVQSRYNLVAGVKITPVAVPEVTLREAEAMAAARQTIRVAPFRPLRVGVITTEGLSEKLRERFRETVRRKLGWYGASVLRFEDLANDPDAVAPALEGMIGDGADLVLTGGGNTIDPLDPTLVALPRVGAEIVKFGAPAHPGSMFWLARRGEVPIFNLASCSMYSKATVADLILPWIMAGEQVSADDLAALGYGGLLDRGMAFRFPDYERDAADDAAEE